MSEENLGDLNPNIPRLKQDLIMACARYGFKLETFEATKSPSEGVFILRSEIQRV